MAAKEITVNGETSFATFVSRPNRFLVNLIPDGKKELEKAFLHDPGRMKELLTPEARLVIRKPLSLTDRKTQWDILAVHYNDILVTINSSLPNLVTKIALSNGWIEELQNYENIKPEVRHGNSRLDFMLSKNKERCFVEVKGVTLVNGQKALFPDAPTTRGVKHLKELIKIKSQGDRAVVLFMCMRDDPIDFSPNEETDPNFSKQLQEAERNGVEILVYKLNPIIRESKLILQFNNKIKVSL